MKQINRRVLREQARNLRKQGKSLNEIADELGVAKSTLSGWVRDIELTHDQIEVLKARQYLFSAQNLGAKANRDKARKKRRANQIAGHERAKNGSLLFALGCMLYWAEGAKKRNMLYFVNSDPNMVLLYMRFLREELNISNDACSIYIHCHTHDQDEIHRIEQYWLDLLGLSESCLRKTQIKKGSDTRKNILENGVCGIAVYSTEITHQIFGAIQEYGGFDNPDWLF